MITDMIYFDFDGTIVDVWERYYKVFLASVLQRSVSFGEYVSAKRDLEADAQVACQLNIQLPDDYFEHKKELLETMDFLKTDRLLCPHSELIDFFRSYPAFILTSRRNKENFYKELEWLGIGELIGRSIVLNPDSGISKKEYLREKQTAGKQYMVGDSNAEAQLAQLENFNVFLVRTGLQKPDKFETSTRITVIENILDFIYQYRRMRKNEGNFN